jgi:hypothetical protein
MKSADASSLVSLEWDWDVEHADRELERKADAALHGTTPFQVDRRVLKDVVRENMGVDVGRITFLSSGELWYFLFLELLSFANVSMRNIGTFHKVDFSSTKPSTYTDI